MALHILRKHGILIRYENSVNNVFDSDFGYKKGIVERGVLPSALTGKNNSQ